MEIWERSPALASLLASDGHAGWSFAPSLTAARRAFSCRSDRREWPETGRSRSRRSAGKRRLAQAGQYTKSAVFSPAAPLAALHGPTISSRGSL